MTHLEGIVAYLTSFFTGIKENFAGINDDYALQTMLHLL